MLNIDSISLLYPLENPKSISIGIVHTQWNENLINTMYNQAMETFLQVGILSSNIHSIKVPGAMEIPFATKYLIQKKKYNIDGILTLGCVIKGDTPHFEYVSSSVTQGITQLNLAYNIPIIFGILTVNNYTQAKERSVIKGREFAISLINMINLLKSQ